MTKKIVFICLFILLAGAPSLIFSQEQPVSPALQYKEITTAQITFKWTISEGNLYVILSAPTDGWVSVGFDPTRMMKDANIIIGYVKGTEVVIDDQFGIRTTSHKPDTELGGTNDVTVLGGSDTGGITTLRFSIPLDSRDTFDRKIEKGNEYTILVAYGARDNLTSYHNKRGKVKITF